ncbi:hypothetical protein CLOSTMETH_00214 [[Clostridium] methylpentosum DSM 5476]|uniref:Uncharacterized protein n=1 Tax=[Clostridium] methylpentosum DSM 5476 TaxID=537013 RepID=C0E8R9_9FIRM|nr:hypothetical protein CLOSTMETH_00214 [[Clostridium] methylpentosum DSM 5476]
MKFWRFFDWDERLDFRRTSVSLGREPKRQPGFLLTQVKITG